MNTLDLIVNGGIAVMAIAFIYIIYSYAKGLKDCPREIYLLFSSQVLEYIAYGAINLCFTLYLSADCGLGDISAGAFIGTWSMLLTVGTMLVGAVVDAIGIKRTLVIGTLILVISRIFMPFTSNIYFVTITGFIPMALGMAMLGPVLSVGIKKFTKKETTALGFGLFYTLMNVGWAAGAWVFDFIRGIYGEHTMVALPLGFSMSTYQIIFLVGFLITIPTLICVLLMRDGVEVTEDKGIVINPTKIDTGANLFETMRNVSKAGVVDTVKIFKSVFKEKAFWIFIFMLGLLVFVKLTFYHFHYTFPKYGIRVLGEGMKIGAIFGVLNPVMIVFLTPLFAALTKKISSYKIMMIGTFVSSLAVFIATIPEKYFVPVVDTWFGKLIFERWLEVPTEMQKPLFLILVVMVAVFTVGEALWSPRLMQFTAEIAPKGKEGSYIALSYLPYFGAKMIAGPLSGWLVATYTPENATSYEYHFMVWIWIGGMALISPFGMIIFRKLFRQKELEQKAAA